VNESEVKVTSEHARSAVTAMSSSSAIAARKVGGGSAPRIASASSTPTSESRPRMMGAAMSDLFDWRAYVRVHPVAEEFP